MADVKNLNPDLQDKDPQLSKEELNARREEITQFYKDNIPHLTAVSYTHLTLPTKRIV